MMTGLNLPYRTGPTQPKVAVTGPGNQHILAEVGQRAADAESLLRCQLDRSYVIKNPDLAAPMGNTAMPSLYFSASVYQPVKHERTVLQVTGLRTQFLAGIEATALCGLGLTQRGKSVTLQNCIVILDPHGHPPGAPNIDVDDVIGVHTNWNFPAFYVRVGENERSQVPVINAKTLVRSNGEVIWDLSPDARVPFSPQPAEPDYGQTDAPEYHGYWGAHHLTNEYLQYLRRITIKDFKEFTAGNTAA